MKKTHYIFEEIIPFGRQVAVCGWPANVDSLWDFWHEKGNIEFAPYFTNDPSQVTCKNCLRQLERERHASVYGIYKRD